MPLTSPLPIKKLKKEGIIFSKDRFFKELAEEAGSMYVGTAQRVYLSLVRMVSKNLKKYEIFELPHLGVFEVYMSKKPNKGISGKYKLPDGTVKPIIGMLPVQRR